MVDGDGNYLARSSRMKIGRCRVVYVRYPANPGLAAMYVSHAVSYSSPAFSDAVTDKVLAPRRQRGRGHAGKGAPPFAARHRVGGVTQPHISG